MDQQYVKVQWKGEKGAYSIQEITSVKTEGKVLVGKDYKVEWLPYGRKKGLFTGKILAIAGNFFCFQ